VERLIHVSTVNAFARGTNENPGTEANEFTSGPRTPGYVQSKILSQRLVLEAARSGRFRPWSSIRPSCSAPSTTSPARAASSSRPIKSGCFPCRLGAGILFMSATPRRPSPTLLLGGRPANVYILAHENLTYGEFFALLADVSAVQGLKFPLPAPLLKTFGALSGFLAPSKTPLDRANAAWLCAGHYYSAAKAVRDLGMPQTPVRTAVADAIAWFLKKGYLK